MKIKDLAYIALFTALISICAQLAIPASIPFTLQTFSIFLCGALLRDKRCLISVAAYILLGSIGLPVFSSFRGGIGVITSATGGFIIGFLFIPIIMMISFKIFKENIFALVGSMAIGLVFCYLTGCIWYYFVYSAKSISLLDVMKICVLPYLAVDAIKIILATFLSDKLLKIKSVRNSLNIDKKPNAP